MQGGGCAGFGGGATKSGFLHIWGRRGAGRGCGRRGRGGLADTGSGPSGYSFGARRIHIWDPNVYRPARDTASGANVWRAPALLATHSGPERVATCAGYSFGSERVAGGYTFGVQTCIDLRGIQVRVRTSIERIHIRRPNVYRRASRQATRYSPYLATACRMRAPHGTQIAARNPTVAAPCRQSHGMPAAYAATTAGQVMGST